MQNCFAITGTLYISYWWYKIKCITIIHVYISLQDLARKLCWYTSLLLVWKYIFMLFIGGAPHSCIICYTRSVITFRGRKGLYKAAVGLQWTHYVTSHYYYSTITITKIYIAPKLKWFISACSLLLKKILLKLFISFVKKVCFGMFLEWRNSVVVYIMIWYRQANSSTALMQQWQRHDRMLGQQGQNTTQFYKPILQKMTTQYWLVISVILII